jgi:hypothetical protein
MSSPLGRDEGRAVVAYATRAITLTQPPTSIKADHSEEALARAGWLLIADIGMGRAEGSARDRPPAQAEPRLPGMTIGPATLAEADRQNGRRRAGRRLNLRRRMRNRRPDCRRPGLTGGRSRRDNLLPTPFRPGRRRRTDRPGLRPARQAEAIDLAQDGAAGDVRSQEIGDPGGRPTLLPQSSQFSCSLRCPVSGGHGDALDQRAQSARPRPPFLLPRTTKLARRLRAGPMIE